MRVSRPVKRRDLEQVKSLSTEPPSELSCLVLFKNTNEFDGAVAGVVGIWVA